MRIFSLDILPGVLSVIESFLKQNIFSIVKWGKEQPKITNLALKPQP